MMTKPPPLDRVRESVRPLTAYTVPPDPPEVKLDANESPWPLPPEAREQVARSVSDLPMHRYPDPRATALRQLLASHVGGPPDGLLLGAGSDEVIALLMTALSKPFTEQTEAAVLFPEPTFVMYGMAARAHGLRPVGVPLDPHWDLDIDAMRGAIAEHRPSLVFLAVPNNPTGNAFRDTRIETILEEAPDALVVVDEAYAPFHRDGSHDRSRAGLFGGRSLTSWCARWPNLGVLGTLSKVGLAAVRMGWIRMHPDLAHQVDKVRQPFNLSSLAQRIGRLALTDLAPVLEEHARAIAQERDRLAEALASYNRLSIYPSVANFLLVHFDGDPDRLTARLSETGIGIKSLHRHAPRLRGHVRITIGTPNENDRLLEALPGAIARA